MLTFLCIFNIVSFFNSFISVKRSFMSVQAAHSRPIQQCQVNLPIKTSTCNPDAVSKAKRINKLEGTSQCLLKKIALVGLAVIGLVSAVYAGLYAGTQVNKGADALSLSSQISNNNFLPGFVYDTLRQCSPQFSSLQQEQEMAARIFDYFIKTDLDFSIAKRIFNEELSEEGRKEKSHSLAMAYIDSTIKRQDIRYLSDLFKLMEFVDSSRIAFVEKILNKIALSGDFEATTRIVYRLCRCADMQEDVNKLLFEDLIDEQIKKVLESDQPKRFEIAEKLADYLNEFHDPKALRRQIYDPIFKALVDAETSQQSAGLAGKNGHFGRCSC